MNPPPEAKPLRVSVFASSLRQMLSTAKRAQDPKVSFTPNGQMKMLETAYAIRGEALQFIITKLECLDIPEDQ